LARFGKVTLGYPGGCCIGKRPIDLHEQTLEALGTVFCEKEEFLEAWADHLEGCEIFLPYPSVGVTENLLLAASAASGMTCIFGAAREPEIVELCRFMCAAGIRIHGIGTDHVCIYPGKIRKHVEYTICKDRIVAGTYLLAVMATGGEAIIKDAPLEHMRSTIQLVGRSGARLRRNGNDIQVIMNQKPKASSSLRTAPYPGFPTDLQSPLLAAMLKAFGRSAIEESMFENRFLIVEELRKMGANIHISGQTAHISPVKQLQGCEMEVRELRGGAALVIAALNAEGSSILHHTEIISRGYENIVRDFRYLNAKIRNVESEGSEGSRKS
jgi:UDP-N-acetylglucosamine 1-carboxyvinyltransferase